VAPAQRVLQRLVAVINARKAAPVADSYTAQLLAGGVESIGAKIVEEANEVVAAAAEPGPDGRAHLIHEAADLLYHLLVMLGYRDVGLTEVEAELAGREGRPGRPDRPNPRGATRPPY
jgi:phosphoribosyl-ATP pyrophosphohydrolase